MAKQSRAEIFEKVKDALVDALSVEEDEVTESARLTVDLGAESIDILDIAFRLEKAFGIKISQDELMPKEVINNPAYQADKKLNAAGLAALRQHVPHGAFDDFEKNPLADKVFDVFTVGTIVSFIEKKVA